MSLSERYLSFRVYFFTKWSPCKPQRIAEAGTWNFYFMSTITYMHLSSLPNIFVYIEMLIKELEMIGYFVHHCNHRSMVE